MILFLLTTLTMIAFAANSVFARLALGDGAIDASSYSLIRLASGALVLSLLAANFIRADTVARPKIMMTKEVLARGGNLFSAFCLLIYIVGFSFAYLALETGMGALILFACVQATMIGWSIWTGNRPSTLEWTGLIIAFGAFVYLVSPGLSAPDPLGTALMVIAGIGWGAYSLRAKGAVAPLLDTAGNFIRGSAMMVLLYAAIAVFALTLGLLKWSPALTGFGVTMALLSGGITSGLGYALWYYCLQRLTTTKAAIVQLSVPAIATLGGVVFAAEPVTVRLLLCSLAILGGVALAITAKPTSG